MANRRRDDFEISSLDFQLIRRNNIEVHGGLHEDIVLNTTQIIYKLVKSESGLVINDEIKEMLNHEVAKMNIFKIY